MKGLESNAVTSPLAGDGVVVLSSGYPTKISVAVRPGGSGDITDGPHVLWRYNKGSAYVPSPILYDGYVYLMTDKGLLTCLDARTGEVRYEGARPPVPASFMASPIAVDGHLLLMSQDGDTFVVKAGPRFELLGRTRSASPSAPRPPWPEGASTSGARSTCSPSAPRPGAEPQTPMRSNLTRTLLLVAPAVGAALLLARPALAQEPPRRRPRRPASSPWSRWRRSSPPSRPRAPWPRGCRPSSGTCP